MTLPRSLLLTVVVVCAAPLCAAQWPCPEPADIDPCVCTSNAALEVFMDCSSVPSESKLASIFQTPFPFNDLKQLIITPTETSTNLLSLPGGVFDLKSFQEIIISNTLIHTVEEQALSYSHNTLGRLILSGNEISKFPLETMHLFLALRELDMSNNKLSGTTPNIESDTLLKIDLSGNSGLIPTVSVFVGATVLEELHLSNMNLGNAAPANMFITNKYLRTLYLNNNGISATLIENFINPELNPLTRVELSGNDINQIHPTAVTGMKSTGTISFRNNNIEYMPQEEWGGLVSQLTLDNAIDTRGNPLVCGCDLAWLVYDAALMSIFHNETTCVTGNLMKDLPKDWFLAHCT